MGPLELRTLPSGGLRAAEEIKPRPIDKMIEAELCKHYRQQSTAASPAPLTIASNRAQQILQGRHDWR
jgi:hypothetical protein